MRLPLLLLGFSLLATQRIGPSRCPLLVTSPDGAVRVTVALGAGGRPTYAVQYRGTEPLRPSRLGLRLAGADLNQGLRLAKVGAVMAVSDHYQLHNDKRTACRYQANRRVFQFVAG